MIKQQSRKSESVLLSNLFLLLLLATPSVWVKPEELLLALLVSHHLLGPGGGAAHQAGHGGALGLGDDPVGGTVGPAVGSDRVGSHAVTTNSHRSVSMSYSQLLKKATGG